MSLFQTINGFAFKRGWPDLYGLALEVITTSHILLERFYIY